MRHQSHPLKRYLFYKPDPDSITRRAIYIHIRKGSFKKRYEKRRQIENVQTPPAERSPVKNQSLNPEMTSPVKSMSGPDGNEGETPVVIDLMSSPLKASDPSAPITSLSSPTKKDPSQTQSQQELIKPEFRIDHSELERLKVTEEEILDKLANLTAEKKKIIALISNNMKKMNEKKEKQAQKKTVEKETTPTPISANDGEVIKGDVDTLMDGAPDHNEYRRPFGGYPGSRPPYRPPGRFDDGRPRMLPPRLHRYPGAEREYWPRGRGRGGPRPYYSGARH